MPRSVGDLGITGVVIAHRLSTIRAADHAVVLDAGAWPSRAGRTRSRPAAAPSPTGPGGSLVD